MDLTGGMKMRRVELGSGDYPKRLASIDGAPKKIYVYGELPRDDVPSIAVVGARMCTPYGHREANHFARVFAKNGVQVISGMALGVDGYAHEGCIEGGGRTFAVLGCGADECYPPSHRALYASILKNGGVLSEEEPGTPPLKVNFPKRNRIISALADIVLVVEARAKSGSLITVDFALEQGRSVYAVPGRVGDALSDGCNSLIAQGAGIAYSPEAVLEELFGSGTSVGRCTIKKRVSEERSPLSGLDGFKAKLLEDSGLTKAAREVSFVMDADGMTADEIFGKVDFDMPQVLAALTELEIMGAARNVGGGKYMLWCR